MSLIKPEIPPEVLRAFTAGLGDFIDPGTPLWTLLLQKYIAQATYDLPLRPILEAAAAANGPDGIEAKTFESRLLATGWRFLAADGGLFGAVHVGSVKENLPPKLTGFSNALQVLTVVERYRQLDELPEVRNRTFVSRMLRVPQLEFEAFWLRSDFEDIIVPYAGFFKPLEVMKAYSIGGFLTRLWPRIEEVAARRQVPGRVP